MLEGSIIVTEYLNLLCSWGIEIKIIRKVYSTTMDCVIKTCVYTEVCPSRHFFLCSGYSESIRILSFWERSGPAASSAEGGLVMDLLNIQQHTLGRWHAQGCKHLADFLYYLLVNGFLLHRPSWWLGVNHKAKQAGTNQCTVIPPFLSFWGAHTRVVKLVLSEGRERDIYLLGGLWCLHITATALLTWLCQELPTALTHWEVHVAELGPDD